LAWALENELIDVSPILAQLDKLQSEMQHIDESLPEPMKVLAMSEGSGEDERVYRRGKHQNLGEVVSRRFLEAVDGEQQPSANDGSGRLHLAHRVTAPANPLFARTAVNRIWHQLFGRGIVATVDNLGVQGEKPTHPELLDWLAAQFIRDGWSQKRMIRRLMLSRTYQQSSHQPDVTIALQDPSNLFLHRANIRRLEGEAIRDCLLAVSGRLDDTMFGASVPAFLSPFAESKFQPKVSGPLDGNGRRSIYLEVRRNYLPSMLLAFDTPTPFTTVGRRNVSNVPAQALTMLNDPLVVDLAQQWAENILKENAQVSAKERVIRMYETILCRPPADTELNAASEFIQRQGELLGVRTAERDRNLKIWADFAHVLLNHKEFMLRN
jgi:hypothetical protein